MPLLLNLITCKHKSLYFLWGSVVQFKLNNLVLQLKKVHTVIRICYFNIYLYITIFVIFSFLKTTMLSTTYKSSTFVISFMPCKGKFTEPVIFKFHKVCVRGIWQIHINLLWFSIKHIYFHFTSHFTKPYAFENFVTNLSGVCTNLKARCIAHWKLINMYCLRVTNFARNGVEKSALDS